MELRSKTLQTLEERFDDKSIMLLKSLALQYGEPLLALREVNAEDILSLQEIDILERIESEVISPPDLPQATLVIILKATRLCNLRCNYCNSWRAGPGQVMDFEVLARMMLTTLATANLRHLQIVWHGGEITLLKPDYVRKALWLQERYRRGHTKVENCIQTNGTRISSEWVDLLRDYRIAVGVSVDSSQVLHDSRRQTKNGKGSWDAAQAGIASLSAGDVGIGLLAVIDEEALEMGAAAYLEGLAEHGVKGVAVLNALPANEPDRPNSEAYLNWSRYISFMREMFAIWWRDHRDAFDIRELSALVTALRGQRHGLCIYDGNCMGKYVTVEPDGRLSACEKYVGNRSYDFGRLGNRSISEAFGASSMLSAAVEAVDAQKRAAEKTCSYFSICQGGCPHDALNNARFGQAGSGCCGLRSLIEDMEITLKQEEPHHD